MIKESKERKPYLTFPKSIQTFSSDSEWNWEQGATDTILLK